MQTVIDIGSHQIWQYVKTINELIKDVPKSRPGKINRKWPAARSPRTAAPQNSYSVFVQDIHLINLVAFRHIIRCFRNKCVLENGVVPVPWAPIENNAK